MASRLWLKAALAVGLFAWFGGTAQAQGRPGGPGGCSARSSSLSTGANTGSMQQLATQRAYMMQLQAAQQQQLMANQLAYQQLLAQRAAYLAQLQAAQRQVQQPVQPALLQAGR